MEVKIIGIENLTKRLGDIAERAKNLAPAFDDMSGVIIQEFKANFDAKGSVLEEPWKPRKKQYSWPILNKTGTMKKSWAAKSDPKSLTIKNTTDYATYHNFGTPRLPVRKLVGITSKIMQNVVARIKRYLLTP